MLVTVYEKGEVWPLDSHRDVPRMTIELGDGQQFTLTERNNTLCISVDGELIMSPQATSVVLSYVPSWFVFS